MDARSAPESLPAPPTAGLRPAPAAAGTGPASRFARAFLLPFRAFGLILAHPPLRRWSLVVAAVSAALLAGLVAVLAAWVGDLLGLLWTRPEGWLVALWYLAAAALFGALFVIGASTLPTVATAPFLDPISVATERRLGVTPPDGGGIGRVIAETANAVGKTALRVAVLLAGQALLLPLWLIPGAGQALHAALAVGWTVFWLAYEYLDVPANRYGYRFREVLAAVRRDLASAAGLGAGIYLILWVPVLNVLFVPVGVVGATVLFTELRAEGRIPRSREETAAVR